MSTFDESRVSRNPRGEFAPRTSAPQPGGLADDHDGEAADSGKKPVRGNFHKALVAITGYSRIPRRDAVQAILGARRNGYGSAAGRSTGFEVTRVGPPGSDTEFEVTVQSFLFTGNARLAGGSTTNKTEPAAEEGLAGDPVTELDGVPGADGWSDDDNQAVLKALGPGDRLTQEQKQMLGALLDPDNHDDLMPEDDSSPGAVAEEYEVFHADDSEDFNRLANVLGIHHGRTQGEWIPAFAVEGSHGSDGAVHGFNTFVYCPAIGTHLSDPHAASELGAAGGGLREAVNAATAINTAWRATAGKAFGHGLLNWPSGSGHATSNQS